LFEALGGWSLDPVQKARLCQRAENQFVGVNCGILDQYTSCAGRAGCALLLDCRDLSNRAVKLTDDIQVVVCNTKYQRELACSEYGKRRAQCEQGAKLMGVAGLRELNRQQFEQARATLPAEVAKRCQFIIEEDERVLRIAAALETGDRSAIRHLCADSFHGACELYEISVPAMRSMMEAMLEAPGAIGGRQAGAGFGGCMVAFVTKPQTAEFIASVRRGYFKRTQVQPEIHPVAAVAGAGLLNGSAE
jgi:galactokinase